MEPLSFEEIGEKIGCTTERARQIYAEGMAKIRRKLRSNPDLAEALFMFLDERQHCLQCPKTPEVIEREPDC
jgi:sigma-70-like protein